MCTAESLRCSPETVTTLLMGYALIQNKKFKKKIKAIQNPSRREDGSTELPLTPPRHEKPKAHTESCWVHSPRQRDTRQRVLNAAVLSLPFRAPVKQGSG